MRASSTFATRSSTGFSRAPGPRGLPVLGSLLDVWRDPLDLMVRSFARHGETVHMQFLNYPFALINRPEDVRHVLVENHANYHKSPTYKGLKLVLGDGLVTSEGEFWRRQRRLAQPAFHRSRIAGFVDTMVECTEDLIGSWGDRQAPFDLGAAMSALTFRIVGHTLFSTELGGHASEFGRSLQVCLEHANDAAESFVLLPQWVPTPANLRFRKHLAVLDGVTSSMIAKRRSQSDFGEDLLGMLMRATDVDGDGDGMTDKALRDEVTTLVLAGHETTANGLTWTLYALSRHPDIARQLVAELDRELGGRRPGLEDLPKLPYLRRVIDESMRLYPPVWIYERQAIGADTLDGWDIDPGTIVGVCPYTMHRNPRFWPNPEGFDPDRHLPEAADQRPRYAYLPFGGGPRTCIGNHFAIMELQVVLATILSRFAVELQPGPPVGTNAGITLRPDRPIEVRVRRRN